LVVFGGAHHEPGVVLVPVKVTDTVSKATVHEEARNFSIWTLWEGG
jgi:hypothetical protein